MEVAKLRSSFYFDLYMAKKIIPQTEAEVAEAAVGQAITSAKSHAANTEIPEIAVEFLKRHPELEEVYLDSKGSAYNANTPSALVGNSILYRNPYFNN